MKKLYVVFLGLFLIALPTLAVDIINPLDEGATGLLTLANFKDAQGSLIVPDTLDCSAKDVRTGYTVLASFSITPASTVYIPISDSAQVIIDKNNMTSGREQHQISCPYTYTALGVTWKGKKHVLYEVIDDPYIDYPTPTPVP